MIDKQKTLEFCRQKLKERPENKSLHLLDWWGAVRFKAYDSDGKVECVPTLRWSYAATWILVLYSLLIKPFYVVGRSLFDHYSFVLFSFKSSLKNSRSSSGTWLN